MQIDYFQKRKMLGSASSIQFFNAEAKDRKYFRISNFPILLFINDVHLSNGIIFTVYFRLGFSYLSTTNAQKPFRS